MQNYTASGMIIIPLSLSLTSLPVSSNGQPCLVPSQTYTLHYQSNISPFEVAQSYALPFKETSRIIVASDESKFQNVVELVKNLTNETVDIPQDVAEIIQRDFWKLI